jgi:2-polyprenyl-6-methoxyphenol hydroxylase-like FAD-dependent oxidoreductase
MRRGDRWRIVAGMVQHPSPRQHEHAIVLGASMAGLLAAQALAHNFERVTIVERDSLPATATNRPGVPQGDHLHVLLPGGQQAIERLLPGFAHALVAAGAVDIAAPTDLLWLSPAGWVDRFPARHQLISATRPLIEWCTRRRVLATSGVSMLEGRAVDGLLPGWDGNRVTGVRLRDANGSDGEWSALRADLVVDATGRRSRLPEWLDKLGFQSPAETRIDASLSYASRIYRRPPGARDWKGAFIQAKPPVTARMGVMFEVEGDRLLVTVQGVGGEHPPRDDAGFLDFVRSLRSPVIYETIRDAEPLTPIVGFANTANRRRHYERLRRWPERLLAVGDTACAFNPVYAQGMSVAALTAARLDEVLARRRDRPLDGLASAFRRDVAAAGRGAWMIATGDDLRYPTTTGATANTMMRTQHRYLDRVMAAATTDEAALAATTDVLFLLARPESLFKPSVMWRALRHGSPGRADQQLGTTRRGHRGWRSNFSAGRGARA